MPKKGWDYFFIIAGFTLMLFGFYIMMSTDVANPKDLYNIPLGIVVCMAGALVVSVRVR